MNETTPAEITPSIDSELSTPSLTPDEIVEAVMADLEKTRVRPRTSTVMDEINMALINYGYEGRYSGELMLQTDILDRLQHTNHSPEDTFTYGCQLSDFTRLVSRVEEKLNVGEEYEFTDSDTGFLVEFIRNSINLNLDDLVFGYLPNETSELLVSVYRSTTEAI